MISLKAEEKKMRKTVEEVSYEHECEAIESNVNEILNKLVMSQERVCRGLEETPKRVRESLQFLTSGYHQDPKEVLKEFEEHCNYDEMIFQGNIPIFSLCEHHMLPFFGVAHVAYIPGKKGKIVGLSKLSRLVDIYARRLQIQERMTIQIAEAFSSLDPIGVGVVLRCRHMCMEMRGVEKIGSVTYTSALKGAMRESGPARSEFLKFTDLADKRSENI